MTDYKEKFQIMTKNIEKYIKKNGSYSIVKDDLLSLYGYYKQSVKGDCNKKKPLFFDIKGRLKWEAWDKLEGMSTEEAMIRYCKKAKKIMEIK
jgi:diazepam-binding inhibitor (GABA receptor modulating acyl-CoA-binding protein)